MLASHAYCIYANPMLAFCDFKSTLLAHLSSLTLVIGNTLFGISCNILMVGFSTVSIHAAVVTAMYN